MLEQATAMAEPDVVDGEWDPDAYWSRANAGEAMPGVLTPLTWSFWGEPAERAARNAFVSIGALEGTRREIPGDPRERMLAVFRGRVAAKVDFVAEMGDRLPGTSGAAVAEQVLGARPEDLESRSTFRRLPIIAARFPAAALRTPPRLRAIHRGTGAWWSAQVASPPATLDEVRAQWMEASARFDRTMAVQILAVFAVVQPIYDALGRLARAAGDPGLAGRLLAGQGSHAEMDVVEDIWRFSRGSLTVEELLARHGYHGPAEGELSGRVWREDPEPVLAMAARYGASAAADSPAEGATARAADRAEAERQLRAALPRRYRPLASWVLRLAARHVPLRGIGKTAFLQTIDVARLAARRLGALLAEGGALEDSEDVFLLTSGELIRAEPSTPCHDLVRARAEQRAAHCAVELPSAWKGRPQPVEISDDGPGRDTGTLQGTGTSPGTVEGRVRVLLSPDFDAVDAGEILVASTTDPSWAPIMFTSAALVVDIGGALSHAAVVAREMGIPCVMGTGDGTTHLRTGDVCRVDGDSGTVEILQAADR